MPPTALDDCIRGVPIEKLLEFGKNLAYFLRLTQIGDGISDRIMIFEVREKGQFLLARLVCKNREQLRPRP